MGEGPALFILHGLFGSGDNWQTIARMLEGSYKVYLVDQRNHGHSPHSPVMNYEVMASDLFGLLADTGERDALFIGHSMGGKTVMRFAQEYDFLVRKMVIADIGIKQYPPHHDAIFGALRSILPGEYTQRKSMVEALGKLIRDESTLQFLSKNLYWESPGKLAWRFNAPVLEQNIDAILGPLPQLTTNTEALFLKGEKSNYLLASDEPAILATFPNALFAEVPGAGHWLHADEPEQFCEVISTFFGT